MFEEQIKAGQICKEMSFNQKVWALTARIPRGRVVTYADIAHKLGTKAYRAVGNALNCNPYAPAVPCHRVVGSDGSLTGFACGVEKKRELLMEEGVVVKRWKADLGSRFSF
ncbi:MAG TPA: MGMT family protein [Tepidisphaeraceae bacterium]|nr:MGMT family protein [Tepidisphaeraceae bacterium]